MAIRSVYAKDIADLRDPSSASARGGGLDEVRARIADAMRRGAKAEGLLLHQTEAMEAMAAHFSDGGTRSLVVIPAAGDRRQIFLPAIAALGGRKVDGRPWFPNTIVLTPTIESIGAIVRELRAARPDVAVGYMASKTVMDETGRHLPPAFGLVTVMTYAGFTEYAKAGAIKPGDVDLLVMAEAHQGLSEMRQEQILPYLGTAVVTAFTGTPAFDDFKSVHRLLGAESEVYSISAQELRNRGVISPIVNYVLSVRLEGEGPTDGERARTQKRKALVDNVLDFLDSNEDPELARTLNSRLTMFYGADRKHAQMFATEFDARYRAKHAFGEMVRYREEYEASVGRKHDPKRSMLRDDMLHALVEHKVGDADGWFRVPQELRTATVPKEKTLHLEALIERVAMMRTPMEFLDGEQSAAHVADVMARVRSSEVRFLANAQLLDGMEIPNVGVVINTPTDSLLRCLQQGAHVQRSGKTGFVINPYYLVNEQIEGFPRFFFEASGDMEMGRPVEFDPRYFEDIDLTGYEPEPAVIEAAAAGEALDEDDHLFEPEGSLSFAPHDGGDDGEGFDAESPDDEVPDEGTAAEPLSSRSAAVRAHPTAVPSSSASKAASATKAISGFKSDAAPNARVTLPLPPRTVQGGGAKTFSPGNRPAPRYRNEPRPDPKPAKPTEDAARFRVSSHVDAIVRLTKQRDLYRKAKAPDPDYPSMREACARLAVPSGRSGVISRVYREMEEALLHGRDPVYGGLPVDVDVFRDGHMRWLGMRTTDVDRIGQSLGYYPNLPVRTDKWLTVSQVGRAIGSTGHPLIATIFEDLAAEWTADGKALVSGFSLVRDGGRRVFALHESELNWFRQEFARRRPAPVGPRDLRLRDACRRLGSGVGAEAEALWKAALEALSAGRPVDPSEDVPFRRALDGGREIGVIAETGLPWLARRLGLRYHGVVAFDPRFHATLADAVAVLDIAGASVPALKAAFERLKKIHENSRPVVVDGDQVSATWVRTASGIEFALPRDCLSALAHELDLEVPKPEFSPPEQPEQPTPGMGM